MSSQRESDIKILENLINNKINLEDCPKDKIYLLAQDLLGLIQSNNRIKNLTLDYLNQLAKDCKKTKIYEC